MNGNFMEVAFIVEKSRLFVSDLSQSASGNPGVGGTEYVAITTAMKLSERKVNSAVVTNSSARMPHDLSSVFVSSSGPEELIREALNHAHTVVVPGAYLRDSNESFIHRYADRIVLWLHHPYYYVWKFRKAKFRSVVSVGSWQFWTNSFFYRRRHMRIGNYYQNPSFSLMDESSKKKEIVYMGALVEDKGFDKALIGLSAFLSNNPDWLLRVVGSSETHGIKAGHPRIPATLSFGRKIEHILKDQALVNVEFLGNMGTSKYEIICQAKYVVLNPTGKSEAYPGSAIDCLFSRTSMLAPNKGGFRDFMHEYPELIIKSPNELSKKIVQLEEAPPPGLSSRMSDSYTRLLAANDLSLDSWEEIIRGIGTNHFRKITTMDIARSEASLVRSILSTCSAFFRGTKGVNK